MSFWTSITGTTDQSDQEAQTAEKKQKLEEAIQRRREAGTLSESQEEQLQAYSSGISLEDTDAAAREGAVEGAKEGFNNVLDFPGKVVGGIGKSAGQVLGGVLKNIPWWVWLVVAGVLFFELGGPILVRRFVARRA